MKTVYQICMGVIFVCLIAFVGASFRTPAISDAVYEDVLANSTKDIDLSNLVLQDNQAMRQFLGLDPSLYEQIVYYKVDDPMQASEYVIVKFKDPKDANGFKEAIEKRINEQINLYQGYAPEQVQLLENHILDIQANYGFYAVGSFSKQMHEQFLSSL